ncbi:DMT family transporter [bacterium]|nr:DMT family transporter [bacterium]MBU1983206.1 DMT family transporter [bacterium]
MLARFRTSMIALMSVHVAINSGGYLFTKVALSEFSPFAFAFWRFLIGVGGLTAVFFLRKAWMRIEREDWPRFLLLAVIAVPANQLLYLSGMRGTVPSHASLLYGSTAVVALALSTLIGYEKLRPYKVVAILLAVLGLTLVVSESPTRLIGTESFAGDLLIALSVIMWASYTVLGKPIVAKYGATRATLVCLILGSLLSLPFLIGPALAQDYATITWKGWAGPLYTGIMITTVSYTIWFALLKRIDPSQVAILTAPQPVVTTILSVLILKEAIGISLVSGGLLVIGGVCLMQIPALMKRRQVGVRK